MQGSPEDEQSAGAAAGQEAGHSVRSTAEDMPSRVPSVQLRTGQGSGLVSARLAWAAIENIEYHVMAAVWPLAWELAEFGGTLAYIRCVGDVGCILKQSCNRLCWAQYSILQRMTVVLAAGQGGHRESGHERPHPK